MLFRVNREAWKLVGYQLAISIGMIVVLIILEKVFHFTNTGSGLSAVGVMLGAMLYGQANELRHPGLLENKVKPLVGRALLYSTLLQIPLLVLFLLASMVNEETEEFVFDAKLFFITLVGALAIGLPLYYLVTRFGISQGRKQAKRILAKRMN